MTPASNAVLLLLQTRYYFAWKVTVCLGIIEKIRLDSIHKEVERILLMAATVASCGGKKPTTPQKLKKPTTPGIAVLQHISSFYTELMSLADKGSVKHKAFGEQLLICTYDLQIENWHLCT